MVAREQEQPCFIEIPWALTDINEKLLEIELQLFGDVNMFGTSAVACTVIKQSSSSTQCFISSKSHMSNKSTLISKLELVAAVMGANLAKNKQN